MTGAQLVRRFLETSPFGLLVGLRLDAIEHDRATVVLSYRDQLVTVGDTVHGGAVSTLIDVAATAAAWSSVEATESSTGSTVSLTVDFLRPARATDLAAQARVLRRGRQLCFCDVEVTASAGELVAKGLVTYRLG